MENRPYATVLALVLLLCPICARAQTPLIHQWMTEGEPKSAPAYLPSIQEKSRFLGWKFAAKTSQDVSRWRRRSEFSELQAEPRIVHGIPASPTTFAAATSSFPNAGFTTRKHLPAGYIPTAAVDGDFNGDGHTDVAISNGGDNTLYVLLGNGDGTFQVPEILYTQGQAPDWITAVSLRNNGHLDLVVTNGDSNSLEVFLGNGDGTFSRGIQVSLPQTPTFVLAGDYNNDGKQDIVVGFVVDAGAVQPQFEVLLGDGSGGFSGAIVPPPIVGGLDPIPTGWIAEGDLNKDGYMDLVTTVTGDAAIAYLSQAGSAFTQGASFGPNDGPMAVELGDMDEDGCLDAVELGASGFLTIAKGTCDGNFTQGAFLAEVGDLDPALKVVDVNGDGHLDIVGSAAYYAGGNPGSGAEAGYLVSVLKGNGKGGVSPAQIYRGGMDAFSLVVADFTGDQRPEIITVDSAENQASFFLNDGSGNYDGAQGEAIGYLSGVINSPNPTVLMQTADVNGDGKPDLILIEDGQVSSQPSQITVLLNDGTGKFLPAIRSPISVGPTVPYPRFAVGAFRSSTKPDLVYFSMFQLPNVVAFFPGNGDGTFGTPVTLANLPSPAALVTGDFNNDGKLDFAVYGGDGGSMLEVDVFLGRGDGTFRQLPSQVFAPPSTGGVQQIFALDLNHDGKLDLLIGNNTNGGWTDSGDDLVELLGNGDGTFQPATILIPHFGAVAVADVNGDGLPDLIQERDPNENVGAMLMGTPAVTVYLGRADGTFAQQPTYTLSGAVVPSTLPVLVGDFNADGIPDIAYRYLKNGNRLTEPRIRVLQGLGDGTFVVTGHFFQLPGYSYPFVGADFNGDGATDLVELVGLTSSFHTIPAAPAPSLDIKLDSDPILGANGSATVTLDRPATAPEVVTLGASDAAVRLPPSLSFAAGQQSQSFAFVLGTGFNASRVLALYATLGTETAIAYGSRPNPNMMVGITGSLSQGSASITPGETLTLGLGLTSEGGYYGTFSGFQCSGLPSAASCTFDASSTVVDAGGSVGVGLVLSTSTSTPFGMYPITITATDGFVQPSTILQLGIGDFALSISPTITVMGPSGSTNAIVTSTSTNGLNEAIVLSCEGLPASVHCGETGNTLTANSGSTSLGVGGGPFAPQDYPFQVKGTAGLASHTINAVLRVGDFSASLDKTSATLPAGQSTTFNVTLNSINHYTSSITVFCQSPSSSLTCAASPSPASLSDDGTVTVQLTMTAAQASSIVIPPLTTEPNQPGLPLKAVSMSLFILFLFLSIVWRHRRLASVLAALLLSVSIVACGGGQSAISQPPPPPPPPSTQTVNVPIIASAASTPSDSGNQKTLGPITITLN